MSQDAINLVAIFKSREEVLKAMDQLATLTHVGIPRAAVVARTQKGDPVVIANEISPRRAGFTGALFGSILAVFGAVQVGTVVLIPSLGAILALGAAWFAGGLLGRQTGRLAAGLLTYNFSEEQVLALMKRLNHGEAALVFEVESAESVERLQETLKNLQANKVIEHHTPIIL